MIKRRKTSTACVDSVKIGSSHPVVIQSMTKVQTTDVAGCIRQVNRLALAGAGLVRIAVPTRADTVALAKIVSKAEVPIIADIHFSPARAIEAIEAGAAKIRLNPGNIKKITDIYKIIDCARQHNIAIRIGVNEASIRDLKKADIPAKRRIALMLKEMKKYVLLFEGRRFTNLVLSAKSADVMRTIQMNRAIAEAFAYPMHLGLTHAGLAEDALVPSAVTLGTLLAEGIGDTIRVSVAGDPTKEVQIAKDILASLGLYQKKTPTLIVCPTCGRCQIDVVKMARQVKTALKPIEKPFRIAVMGCVVNGPGEAADADLAICAAKGRGFIYRQGKKIAAVKEQELVSVLLKEIEKLK